MLQNSSIFRIITFPRTIPGEHLEPLWHFDRTSSLFRYLHREQWKCSWLVPMYIVHAPGTGPISFFCLTTNESDFRIRIYKMNSIIFPCLPNSGKRFRVHDLIFFCSHSTHLLLLVPAKLPHPFSHMPSSENMLRYYRLGPAGWQQPRVMLLMKSNHMREQGEHPTHEKICPSKMYANKG